MEVENKNQGSIWLWLGLAVFLASFASFYVLEQSTFTKTIIILLGAGVAVFMGLQSSLGKRFQGFIQETKIELKKVFWPNRSETTKMTITIMIAVTIVALFLWLVDSILLWLVQKFI